MSAKKNKPIQQAAPATAATERKTPTAFAVKYPLLWLALAAIVVYFPSLSMKLTELDDSIFIRDFAKYNEDLGNLTTSFGRGLFDAVKDPYYRPLFLDSMILNAHMGGGDIAGYHIVNLLLHVCSVLLLFTLFGRLRMAALPAFLLALVFAVHPVLSQAVAWIPGRNDTMLALFTLSFLITGIDYANNGKPGWLALSSLSLSLAFFTKETAVFAAPALLALLILVSRKPWNDKRNMAQYGVWLVCFAIWYGARAATSIENAGIGTTQAVSDFVHRLPVIIQYTGKILLPFNLSVFPIQEDTVYYYGMAAIVLLAVIIFLNKDRNDRTVAGGFAVFLLFLAPALLVPMKLNSQTFEHRLYLPMIGMLVVLSQTVLVKNKLSDRNLFYAGIGVCVGLSVITLKHEQDFADPVTFWSAAVDSSPNSAYANMMLAARLEKTDKRSEALFRKSYAQDPKEKYINYYMGEMLQNKDSVAASEPYLLAEKKISDYYQCDFLLARVAMEKHDLNGAIASLSAYLKRDPDNKQAHNNLLLLYIDTHQPDKAKEEVKAMRQRGIEVPAQVTQQLGI